MQLKIFGDTTPIDWQTLGVRMPFAPMHELAKKYDLASHEEFDVCFGELVRKLDFNRTFEISDISSAQAFNLFQRLRYRTRNTMAALDQATADTICINLGGGYHHAGKYPDTGYAYALINDIIWAADYQLEQGKTIGIIDLDFHFGGGTWDYYCRTNDNNNRINLYDSFHQKGLLQKHKSYIDETQSDICCTPPPDVPYVDKILLNIGTDWFNEDIMFGQYGQMLSPHLIQVWMDTIKQIVDRGIPLAITCGGGYGDAGLQLYEILISWIQQYSLVGPV